MKTFKFLMAAVAAGALSTVAVAQDANTNTNTTTKTTTSTKTSGTKHATHRVARHHHNRHAKKGARG